MKWKLLGLFACAAALVIAAAAPLLLGGSGIRIHQHLSAAEKQPCENKDNEQLCTHLPLVIIDTNGREIPGRPVNGSSGQETVYTASETGEAAVSGLISVIDSAETKNHPDDDPQFSSAMTIRIRGNSSRAYDKPSYMIRLMNDDSAYNDQSVMGAWRHTMNGCSTGHISTRRCFATICGTTLPER